MYFILKILSIINVVCLDIWTLTRKVTSLELGLGLRLGLKKIL